MWLDFEDMEGVCPMEIPRVRRDLLVEDHEIWSEAVLVHNPASKRRLGVDAVVLRISRDTVRVAQSHDVEDCVRGLHQWLVEQLL